MIKQLPKIIVILGPTASGKTDLSVKLAQKFKGEIVSADSRQIYKYLDLGTGKITKNEMEGIPHHLLDIILPSKKYSSGQYQKKAYQAIDKIIKAKKIPFLVGGSAFYLYSVADGWEFPKTKTDWKLRKELEKKTTDELLEMLIGMDPKRAQAIEQKNPRRLIRAIEIATQLGSVPERKNNPKYDSLFIGIKRSDDELKTLIKNRIYVRVQKGMIKEVENLIKKKILTHKRAQELGLEYKWISSLLKEEIGQDQMVEGLTSDIWKFSRHQMNWFNKDKRILWVKNQKEAENLIKKFI
ncbi:MAG: tRNA (adenosine(37)-N6)-dimethylallyltransferase MiaA [Candidatus Paceibacterota bacterium]